nr:MAG TPA: hypothetical protein [Caudoviricetes sp.]
MNDPGGVVTGLGGASRPLIGTRPASKVSS